MHKIQTHLFWFEGESEIDNQLIVENCNKPFFHKLECKTRDRPTGQVLLSIKRCYQNNKFQVGSLIESISKIIVAINVKAFFLFLFVTH